MLQKVAVRMLHDQRFLEKVYAAPMETLSDIGLSSAQIHLLVDADIRRWRADPLRPARLLHALIEEFPVTVASTRSDTGGKPDLIAFFESPQFHAAIMDDASMALTFGQWLPGHWPGSRRFAALELAIARARRADRSSLSAIPNGFCRLSARVFPLTAPRGTMSQYLLYSQRLKEQALPVVEAVIGWTTPFPTLSGTELEGIVIEMSPELALSEAPINLIQLLVSLETPTPVRDAAKAAMALGAEEDEAMDVIRMLSAEGLIRLRPERRPS